MPYFFLSRSCMQFTAARNKRAVRRITEYRHTSDCMVLSAGVQAFICLYMCTVFLVRWPVISQSAGCERAGASVCLCCLMASGKVSLPIESRGLTQQQCADAFIIALFHDAQRLCYVLGFLSSPLLRDDTSNRLTERWRSQAVVACCLVSSGTHTDLKQQSSHSETSRIIWCFRPIKPQRVLWLSHTGAAIFIQLVLCFNRPVWGDDSHSVVLSESRGTFCKTLR